MAVVCATQWGDEVNKAGHVCNWVLALVATHVRRQYLENWQPIPACGCWLAAAAEALMITGRCSDRIIQHAFVSISHAHLRLRQDHTLDALSARYSSHPTEFRKRCLLLSPQTIPLRSLSFCISTLLRHYGEAIVDR